MNKWEMVRLGDICLVLNGYAFKSECYVSDGIRVIRITNVQKGEIVDSSPQFYPLSSKQEIKKYMLCDNDLLLSLTGNVGRVGLLTKDLLPAALNQRVACLRLENPNVVKKFLFHYLNSNEFEQKCIQSSKGLAQKNMSTEWLKEYAIPLPPIETQRQIAKTLDTAAELLALHKLQLAELDKIVKSQFIEMFGDPVTNPMGWPMVELSDCLTSIDSGTSLNCESYRRTGEAPAVLKLSAVTYGTYRPEENKVLPEPSCFIVEEEVNKGDLLFSRKNTREYVGMSVYVYETPPKLMLPDLIFRLNTNEKCEKVYLWKLINHDLFRTSVTDLASGTASSMPNISKQRLVKLTIPLPPLDLQNQFASFVQHVDKSKFAIQQSIDETQHLFDSLMSEYFE